MKAFQERGRLSETLKHFRTVKDVPEKDKTCAICFADITEGKQFTCGHIFHEDCIREWLKTHDKCPVCRRSLQNDGENKVEASIEEIQQEKERIESLHITNDRKDAGAAHYSGAANYSDIANSSGSVAFGLPKGISDRDSVQYEQRRLDIELRNRKDRIILNYNLQ